MPLLWGIDQNMRGYSCDSEDDLRYTFSSKLRLPAREASLNLTPLSSFVPYLIWFIICPSFVPYQNSPFCMDPFLGQTRPLSRGAKLGFFLSSHLSKVTSITALMATADLKGAEYREAFGEAAWSQILGTYSMMLGDPGNATACGFPEIQQPVDDPYQSTMIPWVCSQ